MPTSPSDMLIKNREQAHKGLLDRDTVVTDVEKNLMPWLDLIRDLVNYGTNLVVRSITTSDKKTKDKIVLSVLLRQAVAMLDGVEVQLSKGCLHSAHLQMRALFEASVYIDWILSSDAEKKARYYLVHNLRRKRLWASRMQSGSPEAASFAKDTNRFKFDISPEAEQKAKQDIASIDQILTHPDLAPINADFDAAKKARKYDVSWHEPFGLRSFAAVARATGQSALYVFLYSIASEVMHSSNDDQHVEVTGGKVRLKAIRSLEQFDHVFRFSVSVALQLYRRILEEYRPGELTTFSRKYVEEWQKQYLNFLKVNYSTTEMISL